VEPFIKKHRGLMTKYGRRNMTVSGRKDRAGGRSRRQEQEAVVGKGRIGAWKSQPGKHNSS